MTFTRSEIGKVLLVFCSLTRLSYFASCKVKREINIFMSSFAFMYDSLPPGDGLPINIGIVSILEFAFTARVKKCPFVKIVGDHQRFIWMCLVNHRS